eukprot:scaffold6545_cov68-Phaeocystis_antarctica.AAC.2
MIEVGDGLVICSATACSACGSMVHEEEGPALEEWESAVLSRGCSKTARRSCFASFDRRPKKVVTREITRNYGLNSTIHTP